jgi:hypothetical protein
MKTAYTVEKEKGKGVLSKLRLWVSGGVSVYRRKIGRWLSPNKECHVESLSPV